MSATTPALEVRVLGRTRYEDAHRLQQELLVLRAEGRIGVMQRGQEVGATTTKGPIRLSLCVNPHLMRRAIRATSHGVSKRGMCHVSWANVRFLS